MKAARGSDSAIDGTPVERFVGRLNQHGRTAVPITQQREQHQELDSNRFPAARAKPDGAALPSVEKIRRTVSGGASPDLRRNCPVCGNPYRPGEGVLALSCLSLSINPVLSLPVGSGCDLTGKIILGHNGCVLPRLLTLLAGFQPEARFENAAANLFGGESEFSERDYD
jgi:hypothetical protein